MIKRGKPCTDHMQGNMTHAIICGSGVADPNIFNHASGGRPQTVNGGDQNDGGSQPSKVHGGGTNDHRSNHHNESNRSRNGVDFVIITFTILARLLLHQNI